MIDLDEIYLEIGEFGIQQKIYFFSLAIFNLYPPFNMIQVVFTGQEPKFTCTTMNGSVLQNQCPQDEIGQCSIVTYNPEPDSFGREWGLICSESYKLKVIQSIFMFGVMAGALGFGPIADTWGRRSTLLFTIIGTLCSGIASSFVGSYVNYGICRFFTGFFNAGNMICSFVLASELVGPTKRGLCGNIIQAMFALGIMAYAGLGYLVRTWRDLSLIATAVGGILLVPFLWIPESPRWLFTHHKQEEAIDILKFIAQKNGKRLSASRIQESVREITEEEYNNNRSSTVGPVGLKHIFTNPKVCGITVVQLFSWFCNSVVYYGLTLAAGEVNSSDIYINTGLSGLVELPAYVLTTLLIESKLGRRVTLSSFMIFGGLACLIVKYNSFIGFPLLGKLAIAGSFSIIYIHSAELFPTVIRNSGLGLCSCFARVGGIVSPYISLADDWGPNIQFIILGILSISAGALNLLLPETHNKPMPETIHDLEALLSGYTHLVNHVDDENPRDPENGDSD